MKHILILGGTGAMGIYLVKLLSESGDWQITVTSRSKRENNIPNVKFIQGNAREVEFISELLKERYDVIVDFMNYGYDEFKARVQLLFNSTVHYLFLSSCRVYADLDRMTGDRTPVDEISDINCRNVYIDCLKSDKFSEVDSYLYEPLNLRGRLQNA